MASPSVGLTTEPILTRFVLYKILTFFPVYWLLQEWPLLLIYFLGISGLVLSIGINECSRCLNFACGHCTVPVELRRAYLSPPG